jgi:hypothetical protein
MKCCHVRECLSTKFLVGYWIYWPLNTPNSELQVFTALSLIYALYRLPLHALSFSDCQPFPVTASSRRDSSASTLKSSLNGSFFQTDSFLHNPSYKTEFIAPIILLITPGDGLRRKHRLFSYANRCSGNVFTEPFPSSGRLLLFIENVLSGNSRSVICFAAVA